MHKIYIQRAPTHTQSLFDPHDPPTPPSLPPSHTEMNTINNKKIKKLGLDTNAIIKTETTLPDLIYFSLTTPRLTPQKHSINHIGPLTYNHYCNIIQQKFTSLNNKYFIHKLTPSCFNSHIKNTILAEQNLGQLYTWETQNMPLYIIPTTKPTFILRSQL